MRDFNLKENDSTNNSTRASSIIDRYLKKYDFAALIDNSVHSISCPTLERRYLFNDAEDLISIVDTVTFNLRRHGYDKGVKNKAIKASELYDAISIRSPIKQIPGKEESDDDFIIVWAQISVSVATSVLMAGGSDLEANSAARAVLSSGWNSAGNDCNGTIALSNAAKAASTSVLNKGLNVELAAIAAVAVYKAGILVSKNNEHLLKLYKEYVTFPSKCPVTESHVVVKREMEKCNDEGNTISLCQFINYTNEREKYSDHQKNERMISSQKRDEETVSMKKGTKRKKQVTKSMSNTESLTNTHSEVSRMDNRDTDRSKRSLKKISHDSEDCSIYTEESWNEADSSVLSSIKDLNWVHDALFSCGSFDYFRNDIDFYNNNILSQLSLLQQLKSKGNINRMNSMGLQTKESQSVVTKTSHVEKPFEDESCSSKEDDVSTFYSSVSENGSDTATHESHSVFLKKSCYRTRQSRDDRISKSRMDNDTVRVNSKENDHHITNFIKDDGGNPLEIFLNSTNPEQENLKRESSTQSSYGMNDNIPTIKEIMDAHSNYKIDRESVNTFKNSIKLSPSVEKNINSFPKNDCSNAVKTEEAKKSVGRSQTKQLVSPKEGEFRLENNHLFEAEDSMPGDKKSDKTNGFIDRLESGMEKVSSHQNKNKILHPADLKLEKLPANVKYGSEPVKKEVTKEKESPCKNAISKLKLNNKNGHEMSSKTKSLMETAFINIKRKTRYRDLRKKFKDEVLLLSTKQSFRKRGEKNKKREEDEAFNIVEKKSELKSLYSNLKYKLNKNRIFKKYEDVEYSRLQL